MPRKAARKREYEVWSGLYDGNVDSQGLDVRQIDTLASVLGTRPSNEFVKEYCRILNTYRASIAEVSASTTVAVQNRLKTIATCAEALGAALRQRKMTDEILIYNAWTESFLKGVMRPRINHLEASLGRFIPLVVAALDVLRDEPKRGRMPAYAERGLALHLGEILFEETKEMPNSRRNGRFAKLLSCAFDHVGVKRKDVADLMRYGLRLLAEAPSGVAQAKFEAHREAHRRNK